MVKFWPSCAPEKGVCGGAKNFGYSQRAVFASLWALFFILLRTISVYLTRISYDHSSKYYVQKLQLLGDFVPRPPTDVLCPWTPLGDDFRPRTSWLASVYSRPLWGNSPPQKKKKTQIPKIRRDRRTRGTNSWLDDTDKNFGPDLALLFKLHEIWLVDSQENH